MRRVLFMLPAERARAALAALATVASIATLGCEDGPNQIYQPSPPGAASVWNNGNTPPAAYDGGQGFDAGYPTQNKTVLCSTDFKRERWAWMLTQPIKPPRFYAGLDMAYNDQWDGLTIDEAEKPPVSGDPTDPNGGLCQSNAFGFEGGCPSGFGGCNLNSWGNNNEVIFSWNVATHLVDQMELQLGYTGTMATIKYPDHTGTPHTWSIAVGDVIRRDGAPFEIPWTGTTAELDAAITDIFNATMATFAPVAGVPFDTTACTKDATCTAANNTCQCDHSCQTDADCGAGNTCTANNVCQDAAGGNICKASSTAGQCGDSNCDDGNCLIYNDGSSTIFGIRPLVVYIEGTAGVPQPALSTPQVVYNFFSKWLPFSYLPQTVKLDANGPIASGNPIGSKSAQTICNQQIGQTFSDFSQNCVQVTGNTTVDTVNLNKVTHSLTHDQEHWTANVLGVNQNFTSSKVANNPNIVVLDTDTPQGPDLAQDFTFDTRARGQTSNDYGPLNVCSTDADCANWDTCACDVPGTTACPTGTTGVCTAGVNLGGSIYPSMRGSELIMIEYARELLEDIGRITGTPHTLGDPACVGFAANGEPQYKVPACGDGSPCPATGNCAVGTCQLPGCSGVEGLIIPSVAAFAGPAFSYTGDASCQPGSTVPCLDPGKNVDITGNLLFSLVKPGSSVYGTLCIDPGAETDCTFNPGFSLWENILLHVTRVLGGGNVANLPTELQDRRYYYKFFGQAFVKYLKAYGNYGRVFGAARDNFPTNGTGGLGPSDVMNQPIDLESLWFDYAVSQGSGAAQTFDKFEYIDRDFIGQGNGGAYNWVPWDFEYGCDLFGGNQRYDNWYRRMDREEIAMYASMLTDKTHTAGQENNVNITNLFGSLLLGGNPSAAVAGIFPTYYCAIGHAGDPNNGATGNSDPLSAYCNDVNAPLDPVANATHPCVAGACSNGQVCVAGNSFENGPVQACGTPCDWTTYPVSGCQSPTQTCVGGPLAQGAQQACLDMKMDKNGATAPTPHSLLSYYPGVWSQTPFSRGHSPITLAPADKHPDIGVSMITVPNFLAGPYTVSPILAGGAPCPMGYTQSTDKVWCYAALNTGMDCGVVNPPAEPGSAACNAAPSFRPLVPWTEVQPANGFFIPLDAQHDQMVSTGQLDFSGVLETYLVDYVPYTDPARPSCVTGAGTNAGKACKVDTDCPQGVCSANTQTCVACHDGYTCDPVGNTCNVNDNTINIDAIEGGDFLGQAFVCQDPSTGDILHVGMYDSALSVVDWLAAHPGSETGASGGIASAQTQCQILVISSPYDNYVDYIVSKTWGVTLNISGGQGQGRVTDIVLWDPALVQAL